MRHVAGPRVSAKSRRADDVANIGGMMIGPDLVERKLIAALQDKKPTIEDRQIAIVGIPDALRGQRLALVHTNASDEADLIETFRAVGKDFGLGVADLTVIPIADIPRTETGKVQRKVLAQMCAEKIASDAAANITRTQGATDTDAMTEQEREIAIIWQDVLGSSSIGKDDTFFDLGGDSLSAIGVMLRMEQAGIAKSLSQQIFEGRTIAEIAAGRSDDDGAQQPAVQSVTSNAINFTRGLLVLIVIGAHWGPFVLERMGSFGAAFSAWTWPLFRFGTPGFAMVFGLGLGYFWAPIAKDNAPRLAQRVRTSFVIVATGWAVIVALKTLELFLTGGLDDPQWPTRILYDVLLFYVLAIATIYWVLRMIVRSPHPALYALVLMTISFGLSQIFQPLLGSQTDGFVKLGTILLSSNYSYPLMMGYVLIGVASGLWIKANNQRTELPGLAALIGAILLLGGIVLSFATQMQDRWFVGIPTLLAIMSYAGAMLLAFAVSFTWQRAYNGSRNFVFRIIAIMGVLALPAYVAHAAALPLRRIFEALGLSDMVAIALPVLLVFGLLAFGIARVYRLYFPPVIKMSGLSS